MKDCTIEDPIGWFEELIVNFSESYLINEFKSFAKNENGYFMPAIPYTGLNDESVYFIDSEENGEMNSTSFYFHDYINLRLQREYRKVIMQIDDNFDKSGRIQIDKVKIIGRIKALSYLATTINFYGQNNLLKDTLQNITFYLDSSGNTVSSIALSAKNIFGFNSSTRKINEVYTCLQELGFFDSDVDQHDTFSTVLMSEVCLDIKLTVSCTNQKAAYILRRLEPLFYNLTFRTIDKTKIFCNKKGVPFTENDLSKALHIFLSKAYLNSFLKYQIDGVLDYLFVSR